jgi:hypothetical protein
VALNTAVDAQRTADGNRSDVLYYGLMAPGIPMGPIIGCNTGGVSTGSSNDGMTMAHELGHACGFAHAPCGTPGDPNYPAYEPYDPTAIPQASIGEYGLNISNGSIPSPATFKDMMAYCAPRWISLYNYGRLINHASLDPRRICEDRWWWRDYIEWDPFVIPEKWLPDPPPDPLINRVRPHMERLISVLGVIHGRGRLEVTSVMRLEAEPTIRGGKRTSLTAQVISVDGRVIAESPVVALQAHACGASGCKNEHEESYPTTFQVLLTDNDEAAALRILDVDKSVWDRPASKIRPRIVGFSAKVRRRRASRSRASEGLVIELAWQARCARETESEAVVQWSSDRGKTWYALGSLLRGEEATLDASSLPAGRIDLRLLVSDGFYTTRAKGVSVNIPPQQPALSIMAPRAGGTVIAGEVMRLWGAMAIPGREDIKDNELKGTWFIDDKQVAEGIDVFVTAPKAGRHRARLSVVVGRQRASAEVDFQSVRLPSQQELEREQG